MKQDMGPNDPTPTIFKTDRSPQKGWPHRARALAGGSTDALRGSAGEVVSCTHCQALREMGFTAEFCVYFGLFDRRAGGWDRKGVS